MGADQRLKDEIADDPNAGGYSGMDDLHVANQ